jgi:predicted HTH transcriptional regulator
MLNREHSNLTSASDLEHLREGWNFEAKKAAGADGKGKLPEDFWKTYSAMANTTGGRVVLGVREREDGGLELHGLGDPQRVERELWTLLHDRDKVSANLLTKDCVHQRVLDRKVILVIDIPQAPRDKRPVFTETRSFRQHLHSHPGWRSFGRAPKGAADVRRRRSPRTR